MGSRIDQLDNRKLFTALFTQMLIWGPIVVGVVHQFIMYFFGIERIYVFVDPPGYLYPWASLEVEWWFVLLLLSAIVGILAYSGKFPRIPGRIAIPFYFYILFLLLLVKPV